MTGNNDARPLAIEASPIAALKPNPRSARTHTKRQIKTIAESIETFGFTNPALVDGRQRAALALRVR